MPENSLHLAHDTNAQDRPVAVFVFVTDIVNHGEPFILTFSIERSRREALLNLRKLRHSFAQEAESPRATFEIHDLLFEAITVLSDRSLRHLKRTRLYPSHDDQYEPIALEDTEIFPALKERIDDWFDMGGAELCDHQRDKEKSNKDS
jgi:hypothetical protein